MFPGRLSFGSGNGHDAGTGDASKYKRNSGVFLRRHSPPTSHRPGRVPSDNIAERAGDEAFAREIQELVRQRLSQHEYPRLVEFVAELPKTPAGKVNRKLLRTRENAHVG